MSRVPSLRIAPPLPRKARPTKAEREEAAKAARARLRWAIESAVRPAPGSSELLSRPGSCTVIAQGSRDVEVHDLVGLLAGIHLRRGQED